MLDLPLTLYHVIEPGDDPLQRQDPLDWSLRRQQARRFLARLADSLAPRSGKTETEVGEGERVQAICDRAGATQSILVIGASDGGNRLFFRGQTAQRILAAGAGPVLLVPQGHAIADKPLVRIMVPLDGSSFAEAALTEAIRLASGTGAELLLAHVLPNAMLTTFGPPETADLELRMLLDQRNELAGCDFLERTCRRLADQGLKVRSKCFKGDTRSTLQHAIVEEAPSLVVLTSRGQGGRHCHDLAVGSTASYLLDHVAMPMLLVPVANSSVAQATDPVAELRQPTSPRAA